MILMKIRRDPDGEKEEDKLDKYCDPQEVLDDWVLSLMGDQRRMLSVILYESFRYRQSMS